MGPSILFFCAENRKTPGIHYLFVHIFHPDFASFFLLLKLFYCWRGTKNKSRCVPRLRRDPFACQFAHNCPSKYDEWAMILPFPVQIRKFARLPAYAHGFFYLYRKKRDILFFFYFFLSLKYIGNWAKSRKSIDFITQIAAHRPKKLWAIVGNLPVLLGNLLFLVPLLQLIGHLEAVLSFVTDHFPHSVFRLQVFLLLQVPNHSVFAVPLGDSVFFNE